MLKVDPSLRQVQAGAHQVVTLLESVNQPLVNIPSVGTAATQAFILGMASGPSSFTAYVFLIQGETGTTLVYVSEPQYLTAEQYAGEEAEAVRFVESMGFAMRNYNFRGLPAEGKAAVLRQVPIFEGDPQTMDMPTVELVEVADDQIESSQFDPPAALFGGLAPAQQEAFRRAGVTPQPAQIEAPPPTGVPGEPGLVVFGSPEPEPLNEPPAEAESGGDVGADALGKLGRLLSTFCLTAVLFMGAFSCAHKVEKGAPLSDSQQTKLDIGMEELRQNRPQDAIKTLTQLVEEAPHAKEALYALAVSYQRLGRATPAEEYLRRSIEADPKWSFAKNMLATMLIADRRCEEAKTLLHDVLKDIYYPTPDFAENNLALAERCLGELDGAIGRLQKLTTRRPQFCRGYLTLADLTWEAKKPESTIDACESFRSKCELVEEVEVSPEHACLCYLRKGLAYAQIGDVESARESFMACNSNGNYGRECRKSLDMLPVGDDE